MKTSRKTVMMGILFAVSAFVLAGKLLMPTPIQIVIQGEEEPIVVGQLFRYTQFDVAVISISAIILAASSFYLLSINSVEAPQVLPAAEKRDTELEVAFAIRLLDGDRRKLFSEIVEAGGGDSAKRPACAYRLFEGKDYPSSGLSGAEGADSQKKLRHDQQNHHQKQSDGT
jgi:hypothetical protein